jgi:hypothetical protein
MIGERHSLVLEFDLTFGLEAKLCGPQLDRHTLSVDGLQQSGSECPVHLNATTDDSLCELVDFCLGHMKRL